MGAGTEHNRAKARTRANAAVNPQVRQEQVEESRSLYGKDSPIPTLTKWRGEMWGDIAWGDVVGIMQNAEQTGATELWARLTRRMYQDGHILAMRENRVAAITGAAFDVAPGGPEQIDIQAAADVEAMLLSLPDMPRILDAVLDAIFVGWSVEEIIWGVKGAWVWPSRIDVLEPHRFRFTETFEPYLYDDGRLGNDPGAIPAIRLMGRPLRENKYIVHLPRVIPDYPIASGLLRACARYWWPKWQSVKYWLGGAEVAGNPRAIGKFGSPESAQTTRMAFFNMLQNLSATGTAVIDANDSIEILNPSAEGTGGVWDGLTKWADQGITKTILGSTLNSEVGTTGGNRALGESQGAYTIDPRLKKDAAAMWATIVRDLVRPFLEFNRWQYGGRMPELPVITSRFSEEMEPKPSDLLVDCEGTTINELRRRDGLPEWSAARGDVIAKRKDGSAPAFGSALPAAAGEAPAAVADTALNGAQIASLMGLLASVSERKVAPAAAVVAILKSFPSISEAEAREMVDAQTALPPPVDPDAPPAGVAAPMAKARTEPAVDQVWTDTHDKHRLKITDIDEKLVYFVDLDDKNPERQWSWTRQHFTERTRPPAEEVVEAGGLAGGLAIEPAETTHASAGGAPAASPFPEKPWDLAERIAAESL